VLPQVFCERTNPFVAVQQAAWRALNAEPMPTSEKTVEEVLRATG
jgi:hypothetical protein